MTDGKPEITTEEFRVMARLGGLELDAARADPLVKYLVSLLELDRRLAGMGMETRPIFGDPWGRGTGDD